MLLCHALFQWFHRKQCNNNRQLSRALVPERRCLGTKRSSYYYYYYYYTKNEERTVETKWWSILSMVVCSYTSYPQRVFKNNKNELILSYDGRVRSTTVCACVLYNNMRSVPCCVTIRSPPPVLPGELTPSDHCRKIVSTKRGDRVLMLYVFA